MASLPFKTAIQALLLTNSIYAGYTFYKIVVPFNLGKLLVTNAEALKLPRRHQYTGLKPVDGLLTNLNYFFWPVANNHDVQLSLQTFRLGGQLAAIWMLIMYEGSRRANQGSLVSYTTLLGLIVQIVTYAVSLPLWLTLYLSTASSITSSGSNLPSALDSDSIPACVILGFFVPAILSAIPLSESQTTNRKLGYMALWQMFPLWTGLLHQFARNLLPLLGVSQYTSAVTQQRTSKAIRRFYMTALLIATSTRCASLVVKLGTDYSTSMLTVLPVSLPSPFRISAFKTLEEGIAEFLAYDEIIGSFSLVIWAIFDLGKLLVNQDLVQQLQVLGGLLVAFFFAGPAGLILGTRWARDELLGL